MNCRHCHSPLEHAFLDLGSAPPSNAYLRDADLLKPEAYYPLKLKVCTECWLVQTKDCPALPTLFGDDYAYFSSISASWLAHARRYCDSITERLLLGAKSFVIEIASNDGYLLRNFVAAGVPCLGIEPTASTAAAAEALGIRVLREFFGEALAKRLATAGQQADLIVGNNVYAHVPDINDFTRGLARALKPGGTITLEFPHLMRLIEHSQFDTAYHEHFSYLSLHTVRRIFARAGLRVFDVEELSTHGGSLRIYGAHAGDARADTTTVKQLVAAEEEFGLRALHVYSSFQSRADAIARAFVRYLTEQHATGRSLAAYGAAAKGNTLLNYAGIKSDLIPFVCDASPAKQGAYMPGSRIPIVSPEELRIRKPQVVIVLPWNIADEVISHHGYIREWGGRFAVAVPAIREIA